MPIGKGQSAEMGSIMLFIILAADWQCETSALMNRQKGIHSFNQHYKLQLTRLPKGEGNSKREREREREIGITRDRMCFSKIPIGCPQFIQCVLLFRNRCLSRPSRLPE